MAYLIQNGSTFKSEDEYVMSRERNNNTVKRVTRKMSVLLQNLRRKSSNDVVFGEAEVQPVIDKLLTSDLTVHAPVDGKFTADLKLKKQLVNEKILVLRVSHGKVEVFTKKCEVDQDAPNESLLQEEDRKNRKWYSRMNIFRESMKKGKIKKKTVMKKMMMREKLNENDLLGYGSLPFPDYILAESLTFSLNPSGYLNIQADMKGVITPAYIFRRKVLKLDNHTPFMIKWLREHAWNSSDNAEIRPRTMSDLDGKCKSEHSEIPRPRFFSLSNSSSARAIGRKNNPEI